MGAMLSVFFAPVPPTDYAEVQATDAAAFRRFFHAMLGREVLLPPSPYEAWFTTLAHGDEEIEATLGAARAAFDEALV
jgi:glutamate-1-semialdehyde 2,1-aminomutase